MEAVLHRLHVLKVLSDEFHKFFVFQVSGGRNDQVARHKPLLVKVQHRVPFKLPHRFFGAQDGLAEGMILPEVLGEDFMDQIVGTVFIHLDFFEDHAALPAYVFGAENRVTNQVTENVQSNGQMFVQNFDVEADAFLGGKRIDVSANRIHLAGNGLGRAVLGTFEYHVLDEM